MKYGTFESMPAMFNDLEAWVLYDEWCEINAFEVRFGAGLMSREKFEKSYGRLPALPKRAFTT